MGITDFEQRVLDSLSEIKMNQATITEQYNNLNTKVTNNYNQIEANRQSIMNHDVTIARWLGGFAVVVFVVNFFLYNSFR